MEILDLEQERKYYRCFVGIPLPEEYLPEFTGLIMDLAHLDADLKTVDKKTPHVLLVYLGNQMGERLAEAAGLINDFVSSAKGITLEVRGGSYFQNGRNKVVFLQVRAEARLAGFAEKLEARLAPIVSGRKKGFVPHLTVARKQGSLALSREVEERLRGVSWKFNIEEVGIYGAASANGEMHQEKLINWKLTND